MDIKEDNIIINERLEIKIIDFGISIAARLASFDECYTKGFGTKTYMAPEMKLCTGFYGREANMWAFGITIYRLFTGDLYPFGFNKNCLTITPSKSLYRPVPRRCSQAFRDFLTRLFDRDILTRISAARALNHLWQRNAALTTFIKEAYFRPLHTQ